MPIALHDAGVAVYNNVIYVVGGNSDSTFRANKVESYNPATDVWMQDASLLVGKSEPSVELFGTTIVAADCAPSGADNGDNEAYDVTTNTWMPLSFDPIPRNQACSGAIGPKLYVAGGRDNAGQAIKETESFEPYTNRWSLLASMPQATAGSYAAWVGGNRMLSDPFTITSRFTARKVRPLHRFTRPRVTC